MRPRALTARLPRSPLAAASSASASGSQNAIPISRRMPTAVASSAGLGREDTVGTVPLSVPSRCGERGPGQPSCQGAGPHGLFRSKWERNQRRTHSVQRPFEKPVQFL